MISLGGGNCLAKDTSSALIFIIRASSPSSVTFSGLAAFSTARVRSINWVVILVA